MEDIKTMCPSCGANIEDGANTCLSCTFTFSSILRCPYKQDDNICSKNKLTCSVKELDYEVCPTLREE